MKLSFFILGIITSFFISSVTHLTFFYLFNQEVIRTPLYFKSTRAFMCLFSSFHALLLKHLILLSHPSPPHFILCFILFWDGCCRTLFPFELCGSPASISDAQQDPYNFSWSYQNFCTLFTMLVADM